jgi:hypothetical protein
MDIIDYIDAHNSATAKGDILLGVVIICAIWAIPATYDAVHNNKRDAAWHIAGLCFVFFTTFFFVPGVLHHGGRLVRESGAAVLAALAPQPAVAQHTADDRPKAQRYDGPATIIIHNTVQAPASTGAGRTGAETLALVVLFVIVAVCSGMLIGMRLRQQLGGGNINLPPAARDSEPVPLTRINEPSRELVTADRKRRDLRRLD